VKKHADLWGQTLYSGDLDKKKSFWAENTFLT